MATPPAEEEGKLHVDSKWGTDLHTACKDAETDEESEVERMIANDPLSVHGKSKVSAFLRAESMASLFFA